MKYRDNMTGRFIYWDTEVWAEDEFYQDKKVYVKLPNDKKSQEEIHKVLTSGSWKTYQIN